MGRRLRACDGLRCVVGTAAAVAWSAPEKPAPALGELPRNPPESSHEGEYCKLRECTPRKSKSQVRLCELSYGEETLHANSETCHKCGALSLTSGAKWARQ